MSAIEKYRTDFYNFIKLKNELDSDLKQKILNNWIVDTGFYPCRQSSGYPKFGIYITYCAAICEGRELLIKKMEEHLKNSIPELIEKSMKDIQEQLAISKQAAQEEAIAFLKGDLQNATTTI